MLTRRITYDWSGTAPPPRPGDVLISVRRRDHQPTGTCYLIVSGRRVERVTPEPGITRMSYAVLRIENGDWDGDVRVETLVWHRYTRAYEHRSL